MHVEGWGVGHRNKLRLGQERAWTSEVACVKKEGKAWGGRGGMRFWSEVLRASSCGFICV